MASLDGCAQRFGDLALRREIRTSKVEVETGKEQEGLAFRDKITTDRK
jgi:hypothetical protein